MRHREWPRRHAAGYATMRAMKTALERLGGRLESWVDGFARTAAWLVLAVVFLLFVQNPLREYVGRGQFFANDMGQLAHAAVFMIGVAYAWRWDRQVRVDLFYRNMSVRARALVNLLGTVFLLLPWLALVAWSEGPTAIQSVKLAEQFPETGSPGFFVMNIVVLAFVALVALQAVAVMARSLAALMPARE
jgi:TRAP-type mannitol/chloroaromatic compound transport system permease small subunit